MHYSQTARVKWWDLHIIIVWNKKISRYNIGSKEFPFWPCIMFIVFGIITTTDEINLFNCLLPFFWTNYSHFAISNKFKTVSELRATKQSFICFYSCLYWSLSNLNTSGWLDECWRMEYLSTFRFEPMIHWSLIHVTASEGRLRSYSVSLLLQLFHSWFC